MSQALGRALRIPPILMGPEASLDAYLKAEGIDRKAVEIRDALAALPAEDGLLLISYPGEENFNFRHYLFSHLGWPRSIGALACDKLPTTEEALFYPNGARRASIQWLLYLKKAPPAELSGAARNLSHNLWLVPVEGGTNWNLYCSP